MQKSQNAYKGHPESLDSCLYSIPFLMQVSLSRGWYLLHNQTYCTLGSESIGIWSIHVKHIWKKYGPYGAMRQYSQFEIL